MSRLNRKIGFSFLFISVLFFSDLVSNVGAQTDNSLFYEDQNYLVIENITLRGDGTGVGLTLKDCRHLSLYNVHIENFAVGIKI